MNSLIGRQNGCQNLPKLPKLLKNMSMGHRTFGSYLGLFLGWSLLSISGDIPVWFTWLKESFKKVFRKSNISEHESQDILTTPSLET